MGAMSQGFLLLGFHQIKDLMATSAHPFSIPPPPPPPPPSSLPSSPSQPDDFDSYDLLLRHRAKAEGVSFDLVVAKNAAEEKLGVARHLMKRRIWDGENEERVRAVVEAAEALEGLQRR